MTAAANRPSRGCAVANKIDPSIEAFLDHRTDDAFTAMYRAFLDEVLCVPIGAPVKEPSPDVQDVPAICIRSESGTGILPTFTSVEHLLEWKPAGCLYVELHGRTIVKMANNMVDIDEIAVNVAGTPRGRIPRMHFAKMLALD
jgi:hypothetical protein